MCGLQEYHRIERSETERVRFVYDPEYDPWFWRDKSNEDAIQDEARKLNCGEWVALGRIEEKKCPTCGHWNVEDSLWGIVVENSERGVQAALSL